MDFLYSYKAKDKTKFAVIMCTYRRLENLPGTYKALSEQTNHNFDFYICDNSNNDPHLLNTTKKNEHNFNNNVFIKEYNNKYSIFSRFFLAKELAQDGYEMIVFIDDDQRIPTSFVQDCYDQYEEDTVKSFYAHIIEGDYWRKQEINRKEEANYVGGGGLLCNAKIFLEEKLFSCPEEYYILDDLWISYYIARFTNYKMKKLSTGIRFIVDDKATAKSLKQMKRDFSNKYIMGNGIIE
jgi:glycosyltransferase involved in cell wall biosynthesis